ncbi:MAG TPA: ThiF family adenylyltransferase [Pseudoxanthomonas sp.]
MTTTLVLTDAIADQLVDLAEQPIETGAVLIVSLVQHRTGIRLLGRELHLVPERAYVRRTPYELEATSAGFVPALQRADELGAVAIWVHNHPGEDALPLPSSYDEVVDQKLADTFRIRTSSDFYGTLIVSPRANADRVAFSGEVHWGQASSIAIERLWIVGDRLRLIPNFGASLDHSRELFDRNVRALGGAVQSTLGDLRIGIVGCGGTGSAVAEQLARIGVRRFVLIDPDTLSLSNTTRVYGSTPALVGQKKTEVAASNIQRIAENADCTLLNGRVTDNEVIQELAQCDVVFGCTDDNGGRLVLSRFSTYLLCPLIDCGVLISSDSQGQVTGIDGRVTVQTPGNACLICRSRIDLARAGAELMPEAERQKLEREGYAPALGQAEPAVVTFTTSVAAGAVNELLERLIGFGPTPRPSEVLYRFHDREISTNSAVPRTGHYCDPTAGKWGVGLSQPYLDLAWTR